MSTQAPPGGVPPQPPPPYGAYQMEDPNVHTAKTMVLIAMILQIVFLFLGLLTFIFLIGILWVILDYVLVYKPLTEGRVQEAETPSLVLFILQLIFGGVLPGIFMLIAWLKIKDALRYRQGMASYVPPPPPQPPS